MFDWLSGRLAEMGITAGTVPLFVLLPVRHVDTQMDCVLVKQDGRVQNVLTVKENAMNPMERIVSIHAVVTVQYHLLSTLLSSAQI